MAFRLVAMIQDPNNIYGAFGKGKDVLVRCISRRNCMALGRPLSSLTLCPCRTTVAVGVQKDLLFI
jgi:hypothetical protein